MSRMPSLMELRERAGLTQAEAAENVGLTADDIDEMETTDIDDLGGEDIDLYYEAIGLDPDDPDDCFLDDEGDDEAAE